MVMLSPSLAYFGVDCESALRRMSKVPLFVMAEKTDRSFRDAKAFFEVADGYKTYFQLENTGHGTDALYRDVGLAHHHPVVAGERPRPPRLPFLSSPLNPILAEKPRLGGLASRQGSRP